jgi:hypothetical protein
LNVDRDGEESIWVEIIFWLGSIVEVHESHFGLGYFQTLMISGAEGVFSEVRASNHAAPQSEGAGARQGYWVEVMKKGGYRVK